MQSAGRVKICVSTSANQQVFLCCLWTHDLVPEWPWPAQVSTRCCCVTKNILWACLMDFAGVHFKAYTTPDKPEYRPACAGLFYIHLSRRLACLAYRTIKREIPLPAYEFSQIQHKLGHFSNFCFYTSTLSLNLLF